MFNSTRFVMRSLLSARSPLNIAARTFHTNPIRPGGEAEHPFETMHLADSERPISESSESPLARETHEQHEQIERDRREREIQERHRRREEVEANEREANRWRGR